MGNQASSTELSCALSEMSSDLLAALATKANLADVSRTLSEHSRTLGNKANVSDMSLALDSKVNRIEVVDAFNRPMANVGDVHALAEVGGGCFALVNPASHPTPI